MAGSFRQNGLSPVRPLRTVLCTVQCTVLCTVQYLHVSHPRYLSHWQGVVASSRCRVVASSRRRVVASISRPTDHLGIGDCLHRHRSRRSSRREETRSRSRTAAVAGCATPPAVVSPLHARCATTGRSRDRGRLPTREPRHVPAADATALGDGCRRWN